MKCKHVNTLFKTTYELYMQQRVVMSLNTILQSCLPLDSTFKVLHIQSKAKQCKNLFLYNAQSQEKPTCTLKIKHFFSLIDSSNYVLLGIEINIYLTLFESHTDQHIFVAKADTTGFKLLKTLGVKAGEIISCFLCFLLSIDINESYGKEVIFNRKSKSGEGQKLSRDESIESGDSHTVKTLFKAANRISKDSLYYKRVKSYKLRKEYSQEQKEIRNRAKKTGIKFVEPIYNHISLFTRAEKQYLFPESFRNPFKHIVDGKQLLSWWLKIINQVLHDFNCKTNQKLMWNCRLSIPGSDEDATKKFHTNLQEFDGITWSNGSIYNKQNPAGIAIFEIPLFPDDPKGRFLEHLVVEGRHRVTNLKQFWEELGIRQEFRLGNLVGIIGCTTEDQLSKDQRIVSSHISFANYKRLMNLVKGEDYSKDDSKLLVKNQIPEVLKEIGANCLFTVKGTKKHSEAIAVTAKPAAVAPLVNNLTGLIKRKKKKVDS